MELNETLRRVEEYHRAKFREHGPTPKGLDWNNRERQERSFEQFERLLPRETFSIVDYGCGFGDLAPYLERRGYDFTYTGYDLTKDNLSAAIRAHGSPGRRDFVESDRDLPVADFAVASGVMNLRYDLSDEAWTDYVLELVHKLDSLTTSGFGFNMLTSYSDPDRMRPELYYGDPCFFFDYCKRRLAKDVALLHDYGAYEFTILVRKAVPTVR